MSEQGPPSIPEPARADWGTSVESDEGDSPYHHLLTGEFRRHLRNLGIAAVVAGALPVSFGERGALFVWDLLPRVGVGFALAATTPLWLGAILLALSALRQWGRLALGLSALFSLVVAVASFTWEPLLSAGLFQGFASFVGRQPMPVIVGLMLVAAGAELRFRSGTARASRRMLLAGAVLLLLLYALPQRGKPFAIAFFENIGDVFSLETVSRKQKVMFIAGHALGWVFDLFPATMAAYALTLRSRFGTAGSLVGSAARYGLSGLLLLVVYRFWIGGFGAQGILLQIRMALLLAIVVGTGSRTIEAVVSHLLEHSLPPWPPASTWARDARLRTQLESWRAQPRPDGTSLWAAPGPYTHPWLRWLMARRLAEIAHIGATDAFPADASPARPFDPAQLTVDQAERAIRTLQPTPAGGPHGRLDTVALAVLSKPRRFELLFGSGAVLLVALLAIRLHQPAPNLTWTLGEPTDVADELFGEALPTYAVALMKRNRELDHDRPLAGEAAMILREQGVELQALARQIDAELAQRVETLTNASEALDLNGHIWSDAVHRINERIRELGLPYLVSPSAHENVPTFDGYREFYVMTYRVEDVRRYPWDGREYGALLVSRLDDLNLANRYIGLVRSDEPFAVIHADSIAAQAEVALERVVEDQECGLVEGYVGLGEYARRADAACAQVMKRLVEQYGGATDEERSDWIQRVYTANTEAHEIQHLVDGQDVSIPSELYELVPVASDFVLRRAAAELSAHICEAASGDSERALWSLLDISDFLLTEGIPQSPYRYAAGLLARALTGNQVIAPMGAVTHQHVAELWENVEEMGPEKAAVWMQDTLLPIHKDWFGHPCHTIRIPY